MKKTSSAEMWGEGREGEREKEGGLVSERGREVGRVIVIGRERE